MVVFCPYDESCYYGILLEPGPVRLLSAGRNVIINHQKNGAFVQALSSTAPPLKTVGLDNQCYVLQIKITGERTDWSMVGVLPPDYEYELGSLRSMNPDYQWRGDPTDKDIHVDIDRLLGLTGHRKMTSIPLWKIYRAFGLSFFVKWFRQEQIRIWGTDWFL